MRKTPRGKTVFVPFDEQESLAWEKDTIMAQLRGAAVFARPEERVLFGSKAIDQFYDHFPEDVGKAIPKEGAWILVNKPPLATEYTVPVMSFWFATPWPIDRGNSETRPPCRVRIVTPKGDLGLFPREYVIPKAIEDYYEFIGEGMSVHFFAEGENREELPELPLFYLRSRGIAKKDAISMLVGQIKTHGVCWIETAKELSEVYTYEEDYPDPSRLATTLIPPPTP